MMSNLKALVGGGIASGMMWLSACPSKAQRMESEWDPARVDSTTLGVDMSVGHFSQ